MEDRLWTIWNTKNSGLYEGGTPRTTAAEIELARLSNKLTQKLKTDEFIFLRLTRSITDLITLNRFFKQNHCRYISVAEQLQKQKAR